MKCECGKKATIYVADYLTLDAKQYDQLAAGMVIVCNEPQKGKFFCKECRELDLALDAGHKAARKACE